MRDHFPSQPADLQSLQRLVADVAFQEHYHTIHKRGAPATGGTVQPWRDDRQPDAFPERSFLRWLLPFIDWPALRDGLCGALAHQMAAFNRGLSAADLLDQLRDPHRCPESCLLVDDGSLLTASMEVIKEKRRTFGRVRVTIGRHPGALADLPGGVAPGSTAAMHAALRCCGCRRCTAVELSQAGGSNPILPPYLQLTGRARPGRCS